MIQLLFTTSVLLLTRSGVPVSNIVLGDQLEVRLGIRSHQVLQQPRASTNELHVSVERVLVLPMHLDMLFEVADTLRQRRNYTTTT